MLLHAAAVFPRGGLCRRAVARFDLAEGREALLVPAAQDRVAVGPFEPARGQAGLFIGQADLLFAEAPGEPGQDIVLLPRREPAAGDTEQLLDLPQLRLAQELGKSSERLYFEWREEGQSVDPAERLGG